MDEQTAKELISELSRHGVSFTAGLTDLEVERIEGENHFRFPPDLKTFLKIAVPISRTHKGLRWPKHSTGSDYPNWHGDSRRMMAQYRHFIRYGIFFDIQCNHFWIDEWGDKPSSLKEQLYIAKKAIETAPVMIPLYGHRFIPAEPELPGNPVFSIMQTDIIYYGHDLENYLQNEFLRGVNVDFSRIHPIHFWSNLTS